MDYNFNEEEMLNNLMKAINGEDGYNLEKFNDEINLLTDKIANDKLSIDSGSHLGYSVNFINKSNNQDPEYATEGSAGFDFRADLSEDIYLNPGDITMVPTGLYFELPTNLELQVRPRSGLAAKHGVTVLNTPGTVDSDYRGEVKVILINHGKNTFVIENGERIAQGVIANVIGKKLLHLTKTETLNDSERGEGGFGSTGIK
jgi:dUTP pyrophosphatase